jgi:hypothetical protein
VAQPRSSLTVIERKHFIFIARGNSERGFAYYPPHMTNRWVWALLLSCAGLACNKPSAEGSAPSASASPGVAAATPTAASVPSAAVDSDGCMTELQYLLPPQKYGDADLIRSLLVDGDQIYFRNMSDVFRMPLAGGAPSALSKGPALLLMSTPVIWASGDRLVTQSAGEPIFMDSPKTGGDWKSFIDLTKEKLGGGRDVTTRILHGIGGGSRGAKATRAAFDGKDFYWAEITRGKGLKGPASSVLRTVPLAGGVARTLYETPGEIGEVTVAGDRLVFVLTAPPSAEKLAKAEQARKTNKLSFGAMGDSRLYAVPAAGGEAKPIGRVKNIIGHTVLGADGTNVYLGGYLDEDAKQPGIYRVDAAGVKPLEKLDDRVVTGDAWVAGDKIVFVGGGFTQPGSLTSVQLVLTAPRTGGRTTRVACIGGRHSNHASAVANRTAYLALFSQTRLASIAKVPLP